MKSYFITIIIPVYNSEKDIARCIESILEQKFTEFEVLIINDGSEDNSKEIIEGYMIKDSRIRLINIENAGVAYARQLGLLHAKGEYIYFVDSDDYLEDGIIGKFYQVISTTDYEAVCCSFVIEDKNRQKYVYVDKQKKEIDAKTLLHKYLLREFRGALWCWIFAKKVFQDFEFPVNCALAEDFTAIIHVLTHVKTIGIIQDIGYHYVQNTTSLSRSGFTDRHINHYYNLELLKKKIIEFCPEFEKDVIWTFSVNEMAILTSMCKSKTLNDQIIKEIRSNLKKNFFVIVFSKQLPLIYKMSEIVICINIKLFMKIYSFLYWILRFDLNQFNLTFGQRIKRDKIR